jgi:hypothetical protein
MRNIIYLFLGIFFMSMPMLSAQVRIGAMEDPHPSAILDLNETDVSNTGKQGLALPRVSLASNTDPLNGTAPLDGMMVYNTNNSFGEGVYYWSTGQWIKLSDGTFFEGDAIVGNEVTNVTLNRGLEREGAGIAQDPYTLGIADKGVTNSMIAPEAVTGDKISGMNASDNTVLQYNGAEWAPAQVSNVLKTADAAGLRVKSVQLNTGSSDGTHGFILKNVDDMNKTLLLVNGYYTLNKNRAQTYIKQLDVAGKRVTLSGGGESKYSLLIIEFY